MKHSIEGIAGDGWSLHGESYLIEVSASSDVDLTFLKDRIFWLEKDPDTLTVGWFPEKDLQGRYSAYHTIKPWPEIRSQIITRDHSIVVRWMVDMMNKIQNRPPLYEASHQPAK